jgi:hypothetical protein
MYSIKNVSSLNLRRRRGSNIKDIEEVIPYSCSVCMKKFSLGANSGMLVRLSYSLNNMHVDLIMCDRCSDVFSDIARYGPRVLSDLSFWTRKSVVSRMLLVQQNLLCFNCMDRMDTHIYVRYDDLMVASKAEVFDSKRLCAKCAISYLSMMLSCKTMGKAKLLPIEAPKFGEVNYEF